MNGINHIAQWKNNGCIVGERKRGAGMEDNNIADCIALWDSRDCLKKGLSQKEA